MSSYVGLARSIGRPAGLPLRAARTRLGPDVVFGSVLAAALVALAFVTTGGVALAANTWAQIVLMLIGVALAVAMLLRGAPGRRWGAGTFALLASVTALSAISMAWSVQADQAWLEANRMVSYLAAFGGAIALARLAPRRWRGVLGALAVLATALSAYALLAKIFPATLDPGSFLGRLRAPFGYWTAVGLAGAMGIPACLWAGSRRERGATQRALCVPAITIQLTAILLSYSRSALAAAIVGSALWFVLVPTRLRAASTLALGAAGSVVPLVWALSTSPFSRDGASLASRTTAGHAFGLVLALALALTTLCGFASAFAADRVELPPLVRRRLGIALIVAVGLVPVGGLAAVAVSSRGLTGEISHVWSSLTNSGQIVGDVPGRLVRLSSSRPRYWGEAIKVGEHAPLAGVGAGGYGTARTRYTTDPWIVGHAHSYVAETFADFGLIGLALNLALLVSWAIASARPLGLRRGAVSGEAGPARREAVERADPAERRNPPERRNPTDPAERVGMFTVLCVVLVFGLQSTVDWTWFIPGNAMPALLCAGWLAGRGPLTQRIGWRHTAVPLLLRPARAALIGCLIVGAVVAAWLIWQPLRSANADSAAIAAFTRGDVRAALGNADAAAARDPLSVEPLWERSAIESSTGDQKAARAELVEATRRQPENAATWRQLGLYDLQHSDPRDALAALNRALSLDRGSFRTIEAVKRAQSAAANAP